MATQVPMVDYLVLGDDPHLVAQKCESCGAMFFDRRNACASCGGRTFASERVPSTGVVRAFTIVHRAAPGVPAPFASAVVGLDNGAKVKANIVGVDPTPEKISLGMKVKLATFVAGTDSQGTEAIAFGFAPA